MKYLIVSACFLLCLSTTQAQRDFSLNTFKLGAGYARDFPGVAGPAFTAEYTVPMNEHFEAGLGMKYANMHGFPRSSIVEEYTKATTIDFNFYALPLNTENSTLRIGVGYSFSFYNIRRSYPLFDANAGKGYTFPVQDAKSRASGFIASLEYQYHVPATPYSVGLKIASFKAFDQAMYVGPFVGIDL